MLIFIIRLVLLNLGTQFTFATIGFLLQELDKLEDLKLFEFPPFQDPELRTTYSNAFRVSLFLFFG